MLSILIPVYNYDINPLVEEIHLQATAANITFEIIVIDDCSPQILFDKEKIESLSNTQLYIQSANLGRSAIRNLLASKAKYDNLLFIDAGTFPKLKTFISNYIKNIDKDVVVGGMIEEELAPTKPYKLRWLYTKKREACYDTNMVNREIFTSANFLIKKDIAKTYPFDEQLKKYGFEDFLFFKTLESKGLQLQFINNPVIHDSKEDATTFIKKTENGLDNLALLMESNNRLIKEVKLIKVYSKLKSIGLNYVVIFTFKLCKPLLIRNFNSSSPILFLFDFYKLGYLYSVTSSKK